MTRTHCADGVCQTSGDERRRVMSVFGPSVIKQQLQYLTDEDDDTGDIMPEPIKVLNVTLELSSLEIKTNDKRKCYSRIIQ